MRKYLLLLIVLIILLSGCGKNIAESAAAGDQTGEGAAVIRVELSEPEIQNMFLEYAESGWIMVDCVPVTDSDYGIVGVVQYTTEEYDGCCFDFLRMDGPLQVGVGANPAGEDRLVYLGGDTVTCELVRETGEIYTCTVSYYETETEIGFQVSG